eukprot:9976834-Prorocentrum_lima.AAC.1
MTSSLVGSEMCIRDSMVELNKTLLFAKGNSDLKFLCTYTGPLEQLRFGTCLLYTSDAADDM